MIRRYRLVTLATAYAPTLATLAAAHEQTHPGDALPQMEQGNINEVTVDWGDGPIPPELEVTPFFVTLPGQSVREIYIEESLPSRGDEETRSEEEESPPKTSAEAGPEPAAVEAQPETPGA